MKQHILLGIFCLGFFAAYGARPVDPLKHLKQTVRIDSVLSKKYRDNDRIRYVLLSVSTTQDGLDKTRFLMRLTVEVTDAEKKRHSVQLLRHRPDVHGGPYSGGDLWDLYIPEGDLSRPRITAYVVEYGVMDGGQFVPVAEETKQAATADEIVGRCEDSIVDAGVLLKWRCILIRNYSSSYEKSEVQTESNPEILRE